MNRVELTAAVKREAQAIGFDFCHFTPVDEAPHADFFDAWIDAGRAGEMVYLERNRQQRRFPALLAEPGSPSFHTIIVLGIDYHQFNLPPEVRDDPSRGIVASYAWGDDYHEIIRPQLYELDAFIRTRTGRTTLAKCLVDTGPVLERDWATVAGLGFTGKNCCLIRPPTGSWIFLAVMLVPETLAVNAPLSAGQTDHRRQMTCGRCTRCLTACPTGAFASAYDLDPGRCISYWTIESRSIIPRQLRPHFGNRIFGCDICQEVCPYNRRLPDRTPLLAGLQVRYDRIAPPLLEGFDASHPYWLNQTAFGERFRRSPIKRARRAGMLRNVCVALGNWGDPAAVEPLAHVLADTDAVARVHAAWALGRILQKTRHAPVASILAATQTTESDERVREEVSLALGSTG